MASEPVNYYDLIDDICGDIWTLRRLAEAICRVIEGVGRVNRSESVSVQELWNSQRKLVEPIGVELVRLAEIIAKRIETEDISD